MSDYASSRNRAVAAATVGVAVLAIPGIYVLSTGDPEATIRAFGSLPYAGTAPAALVAMITVATWVAVFRGRIRSTDTLKLTFVASALLAFPVSVFGYYLSSSPEVSGRNMTAFLVFLGYWMIRLPFVIGTAAVLRHLRLSRGRKTA